MACTPDRNSGQTDLANSGFETTRTCTATVAIESTMQAQLKITEGSCGWEQASLVIRSMLDPTVQVDRHSIKIESSSAETCPFLCLAKEEAKTGKCSLVYRATATRLPTQESNT